MEILYPRCCGIDVHKKSVTACVNVLGADGRSSTEVRRFATTTRALGELAEWLRGHRVE